MVHLPISALPVILMIKEKYPVVVLINVNVSQGIMMMESTMIVNYVTILAKRALVVLAYNVYLVLMTHIEHSITQSVNVNLDTLIQEIRYVKVAIIVVPNVMA